MFHVQRVAGRTSALSLEGTILQPEASLMEAAHAAQHPPEATREAAARICANAKAVASQLLACFCFGFVHVACIARCFFFFLHVLFMFSWRGAKKGRFLAEHSAGVSEVVSFACCGRGCGRAAAAAPAKGAAATADAALRWVVAALLRPMDAVDLEVSARRAVEALSSEDRHRADCDIGLSACQQKVPRHRINLECACLMQRQRAPPPNSRLPNKFPSYCGTLRNSQ